MFKEIKFVIYGEPTGKGRPKFVSKTLKSGQTFTSARTPEKTVIYENLVKMEYLEQTNAYRFPDNAELEMVINAYYSIPKSKSKKMRQAMIDEKIRPVKKPDMDNVIKIIADSLNEVAYKDDTQIVTCICRKWYSETPRVEVSLMDIKDILTVDNNEE